VFGTGGKLKIGRIGGHELYLDVFPFALLGLWLFWGARGNYAFPISFLVAAVFSIIVHELGHAVAIKKLTGLDTAIIIGFGGATISYGKKSARSQFLISLAGPAAGVLLGGVAWMVASRVVDLRSFIPWDFYAGDSIWLLTLQNILWLSVALTVLNLLPAIPLDGGQALRALLVIVGLKAFRARRYTRVTSLGVAGLMIYWQQNYDGSRLILFIAAWIVLSCLDEFRVDGW